VLLTIVDYLRLTGERPKIADAFAMPGVADVDLDPPRAAIKSRPAEFS
jgi:hypothetical protein